MVVFFGVACGQPVLLLPHLKETSDRVLSALGTLHPIQEIGGADSG